MNVVDGIDRANLAEHRTARSGWAKTHRRVSEADREGSTMTHRGRASEMLASLEGKLPGTATVIAAAHAHAVLAVADELHALRVTLQELSGSIVHREHRTGSAPRTDRRPGG
ncbi:hypothetical protein ACWT_4264 [Actinoplanes sp. SE50]|uniref:hypothetical protein n=2 Tax=Actinoplanes TaxID=1865 RepID=UPI00023EC63C|nr:hypothetical protein [Actinoplanes sp. SE50/110]AEV85284.1 hypothetical protein ACPL_4393 [Actinoplanes sp. SE50/110]ATO83679.1 hypothetical protein ACWT_4264 [Actinoplanes sp. SE50]SLM01087.1 hypothetical protein ACSP50_4320 [Actinoplanes sp. SE50/110]